MKTPYCEPVTACKAVGVLPGGEVGEGRAGAHHGVDGVPARLEPAEHRPVVAADPRGDALRVLGRAEGSVELGEPAVAHSVDGGDHPVLGLEQRALLEELRETRLGEALPGELRRNLRGASPRSTLGALLKEPGTGRET